MVQVNPLLVRAGEEECLEYKITYPGHLKIKIAREKLLKAFSPEYDERSIQELRKVKVTLAEVDGKPAVLVSPIGYPEGWNWVGAKVLFRREPVIHILIESWTLQSKLYKILTGEDLRYMTQEEAARMGKPEVLKYPIETMNIAEDELKALAVIPIPSRPRKPRNVAKPAQSKN